MQRGDLVAQLPELTADAGHLLPVRRSRHPSAVQCRRSNGQQLVAYAKTQAEQIVLTVQLTELPAAQWIETAFDS